MSVKIKDIAKLAGVSTATVSRVINNSEKVRPDTRQRVESAISKSNYKPNYFARGLNNGFTDSVGILASHTINPYFTEIVNAIEQVLSQNGVYIYVVVRRILRWKRSILRISLNEIPMRLSQ
jgi:LacI family transcriptional regulator